MANIKQITVNGITYNIRDDSKLSTSLKGAANGLAELDENGVLKESQLPVLKSLYGTTAHWNSQLSFVPEAGQIVIYSDHGTADGSGGTVDVPGIKVGDGNAYCVDLPFVGDDVAQYILEQLANHTNNADIHVTSNDKTNWNNKVAVGLTGEVLEFTK